MRRGYIFFAIKALKTLQSAHAQRWIRAKMEELAEEKEAEARRLRSCFVEQLQAQAARERQ